MDSRTDEMNRDVKRRDEVEDRRADAVSLDPVTLKETTVIDAEIERTRAEMSRTVDEIQQRLSPENIKNQLLEQVRGQYEEVKDTVMDATVGRAEDMIHTASDKIGEAGSTLVDTVRGNPIPYALIGIGTAWLMMNRGSSSSKSYRSKGVRSRYGSRDARLEAHLATCPTPHIHEYGTRTTRSESEGAMRKAGELAGQARSAVGDAAESVMSTTSHYADEAQRKAGELVDDAQYQARQIGNRVSDVVDENPLILGALGLAVGAAIGLALPQTRKENELMGETRDHLLERAEQVAERAMESGERVMDRAASEAKRAVEKESSTIGREPTTSRPLPPR